MPASFRDDGSNIALVINELIGPVLTWVYPRKARVYQLFRKG
jgi:hypothetical protein